MRTVFLIMKLNKSDLETTFLKRDGGTNYRDSQIYEMMMSGTDGYDWTDLVTRTGNQQNHYISANGATEKINYRLGVGYIVDCVLILEKDSKIKTTYLYFKVTPEREAPIIPKETIYQGERRLPRKNASLSE